MANLAILSVDDGGKRRTLRSARYRLPALWLACFEPGDVAEPSGEDEVLLSTTPARAFSLLERRRPALRALVANLDEFLPAWSAFLHGLEGGRLVVDATEVLEMEGTSPGLAAPLRLALRAFEAPTQESMVALLRLCSLGDHRDDETGAVSTPGPRRVVDAVPEVAGLLPENATLPSEPADVVLTGSPWPDDRQGPGEPGLEPAPAPRARKQPGAWPLHRKYAAMIAGAFAIFVLTLVRRGRPPSPFGWTAVGWTAAAALSLWFRPRIGLWVYAGGTGVWAAGLGWWLATGTGRSSVIEVVAALLMLAGSFQLRTAVSRAP